MKRAVILHGTDGKPSDQWFPWLKRLLETNGYLVFVPLLPDNHKPNRLTYEKYLKESDWDFSSNLMIGHSSGATTVLNLLSSDWFPKQKAVVLAGTFLNEKLTKDAGWFEPGQFDGLFMDKYDPKLIKSKAEAFIFLHGSNDPYCDIKDAQKLCEDTGGEFIVIKNGHHLGGSSGVDEIPQLEEALKKRHLL
jgi:predicted alpha/beta hydrolase family esterase